MEVVAIYLAVITAFILMFAVVAALFKQEMKEQLDVWRSIPRRQPVLANTLAPSKESNREAYIGEATSLPEYKHREPRQAQAG